MPEYLSNDSSYQSSELKSNNLKAPYFIHNYRKFLKMNSTSHTVNLHKTSLNFPSLYPDSAFKALTLFINELINRKNTDQTMEEQDLKELILYIFTDRSEVFKDFTKISENFFKDVLWRNFFKSSKNTEYYENFKFLSNDEKKSKYVAIMLTKANKSGYFEIFAMDVNELSWIGLKFVQLEADPFNLHEIIMEYMKVLNKANNMVFVLFSNFFKESNFSMKLLMELMQNNSLLFIQFCELKQEDILPENFTSVITSSIKLPRITSNSSDEIEKILDNLQSNERFTEVHKAFKRIKQLKQKMKKFHKMKNQRVVSKIFDYFALGLSNMFILQKKIFKKKNKTFKKFLNRTFIDVCKMRQNGLDFEFNML